MKRFARKALSLFMVLVLAVCALPLSGIDFKDIFASVKAISGGLTDEYAYSTYAHQYGGNYGGIILKRYYGNDEHVVIPSHIDGYAVRIIEGFYYISPDEYYDEEGYDNSFLKSVVVPETALIIGSHAFKGAKNLESVILPYGLERIEGSAFEDCVNLKEITIPDTVEDIDFSAFVNTGVEEITLGGSVTDIDFSEFYGTNIKRVIFNGSDLTFYNFNAWNDSLEEIVCNGTVYRVSSAYPENETDAKLICNEGVWITAHKQLVNYEFYPHFDNENGSVTYTAYPDENVPAETVSGNYRYYLNENSEAVISRYLGTESVIVVPETLDGYIVTEIGSTAFHAQGDENTIFGNIIPYEMITSITLPETVTKIGISAFAANKSLESINLPSGIEHIPDGAFASCVALRNIQIPAGVKTIGGRAFYLCRGLYEIDLPEGLRKIESYAFSRCENLTTITIPDSVEYLGNCIFIDCDLLTSAVLPEGLTELSYGLFESCDMLESVVLPDTLTKINPFCFAGTILSDVYLPDRVALIERFAFSCDLEKIDFSPLLKRIGKYAFEGVNFKSFILPNRIEHIGYRAFSFCEFQGTVSVYGKNLVVEKDAFYASTAQRVEIKSGVASLEAYAFDNCKASEIIIDEGVEAIGRCAFTNCVNATEITIPKSIAYMGASVFSGCTNIKTINYNAVNCTTDGSNKRPFSGLNPEVLNIGSSVESISDSMFAGFSLIESVTLPETLKSLGTGVFKNCESLKSLELPDGVKTIGDYTFSGCTALESITFTDELESIGKSAFANCTALTEITIPEGIKVLDLSAFENCTSIKTVYYNATNCKMTGLAESPVEGVYYSPFYTCTSVESIILSEKIKTVPDFFFCGLASVSAVDIPESVTELGKAAFAFCNVSNISGGENIKKGGDYCFYSCKSLKEMVLPPGIADLGDYVFAESGLTAFVSFSTLESIGDYCFLNCTDLNYLKTEEGVMIIGNNAFEGCTSLEKLTVPESVKNIGECAYKGCTSLKSVKMSSNIIFIPDECFNFCTSLSSFEWNVESKLIGRLAFGNCSSLFEFNFIGIEKLYENSFYKSGVGVVTLGEALNSEAAKLEEIEVSSFMDCDNLETVSIGGNVSTVMSLAFADCDNLSTAMISDNVTDIADDAFDGCDNLTIMCSTDSYAYNYANARGIPVSTFVIATIPNQNYTGYALKPDVEVSMSGNTLTKNIDFTADYSNNINVGTAKVKITGSGDYKMFSSSATFTIVTRHIGLARISEVSEQAYTGKQVKPKIVLTDNGKILTEGKDYTITYRNNIEVGEAVAVANGIGNYSGYSSVRFNIEDQSAAARFTSFINQMFNYISFFITALFKR
ncbi:MAG: leucine-rich repeat domain-containing protein [Clostridia bacterium]|nr:leucine-rich repeat domain-containing protein [Clostridia bacterium]